MADQSFFEKAQKIDRRWIFLFIAIGVIVPLAMPDCGLKEEPTPEVQSIFDRVEGLEDELGRRGRVLLAMDFDPPSEPELLPMATSFMRHLAIRGHQIYFTTLWAVGVQEIYTIWELLEEEFPEYQYGVDFVALGFKVGGQGVIQSMVNDIRRVYMTDMDGVSIDNIPMMDEINTLADFDLILNVSAGFPGLKEWILFGSDPTGVPIAGGVTAVSAPLLYPYYPNQMLGIKGGLKAAAEYEALLQPVMEEHFGDISAFVFAGTRRMGAQTAAHLIIILFILIGNIAYFGSRGKSSASSSKN